MTELPALPVTIEVDGKTYSGSYRIDTAADKIMVMHDDKEKTARLGGDAATLAALMLRELVTGA